MSSFSRHRGDQKLTTRTQACATPRLVVFFMKDPSNDAVNLGEPLSQLDQLDQLDQQLL